MVVPFTLRPGVTTVPVSLVLVLAAQLVGTLLHKLPVHVGPPETQLCAPVVVSARQAALLLQAPEQLGSLTEQVGQQLST
jgi:hypothetical protein